MSHTIATGSHPRTRASGQPPVLVPACATGLPTCTGLTLGPGPPAYASCPYPHAPTRGVPLPSCPSHCCRARPSAAPLRPTLLVCTCARSKTQTAADAAQDASFSPASTHCNRTVQLSVASGAHTLDCQPQPYRAPCRYTLLERPLTLGTPAIDALLASPAAARPRSHTSTSLG